MQLFPEKFQGKTYLPYGNVQVLTQPGWLRYVLAHRVCQLLWTNLKVVINLIVLVYNICPPKGSVCIIYYKIHNNTINIYNL